MPYISTEALVGAALLVVLAVGYQYLPKAPGGSGSNAAKKKGKKRSKPTPAEEAQSEPAAKTGSKGKRKPSGSGEDVSRAAQAAKQAGNSTSMPDEVTNGSPSFAAVAGGSQSAMPKTLVERLAPKARKTKVDE